MEKDILFKWRREVMRGGMVNLGGGVVLKDRKGFSG